MIKILTATSFALLIGVILRERHISNLESALNKEREISNQLADKLDVMEFENTKNSYRSDGVSVSPELQQMIWDAVMNDDCDCILEATHFVENEAVE